MQKADNAVKDIYWRKPMDARKQAIVFACNIWKLIPGILIGAILGVLLWTGYHAIADGMQYSGYSEFYLDFAMMENGAAYDYYNGYTWNDLMTTDPIAAHTLENLGGRTDISGLERVTTAQILSDIRVLRVTFADSDESLCSDIQSATEQALVKFGDEAKEFEQISLIKSVKPERQMADDRTLQALLLGAIIGLLTTLAFMNYKYLLDDAVMVPSDISDLGIGLLTISTADHDEKLESKLNAYAGSSTDADGNTSDSERAAIVHLNASEYQNGDGKAADISGGTPVIITVPYRKATRSALTLMTDRLKAAGADVLGVEITGADSRFYRAYYSFMEHKKDHNS